MAGHTLKQAGRFPRDAGVAAWALPSQWSTTSSSFWGKASAQHGKDLARNTFAKFIFQLPPLGRRDSKTAFPLGRNLPFPVLESPKNRVIQEEEDLGTAQGLLPQAQTILGAPHLGTLKSPGGTQGFPVNSCVPSKETPSLLPPRDDEQKME